MSQPTLVITQQIPTQLVLTQTQPALLAIDSGKGLPGSPGTPGANGRDAVGLVPLPFSRFGPQYVSQGDQRFYVDYDVRLLSARVSLGIAPEGSDLVVRVNLDGTPLLSVSVPDGMHSTLAGVDEDIAAGSYFTIDVTGIGSTNPGEDLTVTLWMKAVAA